MPCSAHAGGYWKQNSDVRWRHGQYQGRDCGQILDSESNGICFEYKSGKQLSTLSIPYERINALEYGQKAGRRIGVAIAVALVAPILPDAKPGGRPRTTNLRAVLNAIFYLLRTGCQWRLLPHGFPPWGTVYHYFRSWDATGIWVKLHRAVYEQARVEAGRGVPQRGDHGR